MGDFFLLSLDHFPLSFKLDAKVLRRDRVKHHSDRVAFFSQRHHSKKKENKIVVVAFGRKFPPKRNSKDPSKGKTGGKLGRWPELIQQLMSTLEFKNLDKLIC